MRVFLSVDMLLCNGTNPNLARQPIKPMRELRNFHHLKQRFREQNMTKTRTAVELSDGDTNVVVIKAEKK